MEMKTRVASPLPQEAWKDVQELAAHTAVTAGGRFRCIEDIPEGSVPVCLPGGNIESAAVDLIAAELEERYPEMAEEMNAGLNKIVIDKMAADLSEGKNIALNMNHGTLLRSGIGLRLVSRSLEEQGVEVEKSIIGGIALLGLEVKLENSPQNGEGPQYVKATDAAGMISDHFLVSIPNSKRGQLLREKYTEETNQHNALMKQILNELLEDDKGVLLMMLGSGTHDRPKEDDPNTILIDSISDGTIDLIKENKLRVVQSAVSDLPGQPMAFQLVCGPNVLETHGQMHRDMARIARMLGSRAAGVNYKYQDPRI